MVSWIQWQEPKEEKKDAPPDAKPDFSGHWVQVAVEGPTNADINLPKHPKQ